METTTPTSAIAEYNPIAAVLAELTKRHRGVIFDCTQPSGLREAKAAAKDIAQYRIALEKKRTELKADVLERGRLIDGEAKRIAVQLAAIEEPIVDQIKAEERRIEAEREAAIRAEQERLAAEERARKEAEERKLAEERSKLAAERAELERAQAEQRAAEAIARREREEADRQARAKIEAEERASRERIAAAEAEATAQRRAEEDRLRAERDRLDADRRSKEEADRKERDALEAKRREEDRKANELLDARGMLTTFRTKFGHLKPFARVVKAIDALPADLKVAA